VIFFFLVYFFFFKQKTAYEMRISDWSSDVCSSDLVDGDQLALDVEMPEGPAVARRRALQVGADLVDRALEVGGDEGAVGAHLGAPALVGPVQHGARLQQAVLDEPAEGDARLRRSEEHTSELQSLMRISYAVFCLKKKNTHKHTIKI